jgi:hypothetical protein
MNKRFYFGLLNLIFLFVSGPLLAQTDVRKLEKVMWQSDAVFSEAWSSFYGRAGGVPTSIFKDLARHLGAGGSKLNICDKNAGAQINWIKSEMISGQPTFSLLQGCQPNQAELYRLQSVGAMGAVRNWRLVAKSSQLKNALGDSLSLLGRDVVCNVSVKNDVLLVSLSCEGLGHGRGVLSHVEFKKFEYNTQIEQMLVVKADQYSHLTDKELCDAAEPCLSLVVPAKGQIKIVENRIVKKKTTFQGTGMAVSGKIEEQAKQQKISIQDKNAKLIAQKRALRNQNKNQVNDPQENLDDNEESVDVNAIDGDIEVANNEDVKNEAAENTEQQFTDQHEESKGINRNGKKNKKSIKAQKNHQEISQENHKEDNQEAGQENIQQGNNEEGNQENSEEKNIEQAALEGREVHTTAQATPNDPGYPALPNDGDAADELRFAPMER